PEMGLSYSTESVLYGPTRNPWNTEHTPGVQFIGRFGDEATLFRLTAQLEEAAPWAGRRPEVE
ncbi:MAG: hypothetical protein ACE5LF_07045, partial [Alphaproteobacteria bacterium]